MTDFLRVAVGFLPTSIDGEGWNEVKEAPHRLYSISPLRPYFRVDAHGSQFDDADDEEAGEIKAKNHLFNQRYYL